jgi:hypothetical protein
MGDAEMDYNLSNQSQPVNNLSSLPFLIDAAKPGYNWEENASKFKQEFIKSIDQIARLPKQTLIDALDVFNKKDGLISLREDLANDSLKFAELSEFFEPKRRNKTADLKSTFEDIYQLVLHLVEKKPINKSRACFDSMFKEKNLTTADAVSCFLLKQTEMMSIINSQSHEINELKTMLTQTNRLLEKLFDENNRPNKTTSSNQQHPKPSWPPLNATFSMSNLPNIFASTRPTSETNSLETAKQSYTPKGQQKRPPEPYSNPNASKKITQTPNANLLLVNRKPMGKLMNLNSINDPEGPPTEIQDNNWTKVVNRRKPLNINQYVKKVGTNQQSNIKAIARKQRVFITRLDNSTRISDLEDYLQTVKYKRTVWEGDQDAEIQRVKEEKLIFSDIKEAQLKHTAWKAFTFEIDLLQKDIINSVDTWPIGSFVTQSRNRPPATLTTTFTNTAISLASSTSQTTTQHTNTNKEN